ncbi:hypothetical protein KC853_01120 [Candidatus Saccharibacteria bacterium]|nr:hypothetical protein [Candidatus Saccharibacteria bacterium]MCB9834821.1 hypothetical protein [Candidatus Nomurabacteria bacterium]
MSIGVFIQALLIMVIPAYLLVLLIMYRKQQKLEDKVDSLDQRMRLVLAKDIKKMIGSEPINREAKILLNLARFLEKTATQDQVLQSQIGQLATQNQKTEKTDAKPVRSSELSFRSKPSKAESFEPKPFESTQPNSKPVNQTKDDNGISLGQLLLTGLEYLAGIILLSLPLVWWKSQIGHGNYPAQLIFLGIVLILTILIAIWRGHGFYNFVAYILLFLIIISWFAINSYSLWWIFIATIVFVGLGRALPKRYQPEYYLLAVFGLLGLAIFALMLPGTVARLKEQVSDISLSRLASFSPKQLLAWVLLGIGYSASFLRSRNPAKFDLKQRLITAVYSIAYIGALVVGFYSQTSSWLLILLILMTIVGLIWIIKIERLSEMIVIVLLLSYIVGLQAFDLLDISNVYIGYSVLFVSLVGYSISYLLRGNTGRYLRNFSLIGIILALFTQVLTDPSTTTLINIATTGVILIIFDQIIRIYQKKHALEQVTSYIDNNQLEHDLSIPLNPNPVRTKPQRQSTADISFVPR